MHRRKPSSGPPDRVFTIVLFLLGVASILVGLGVIVGVMKIGR